MNPSLKKLLGHRQRMGRLPGLMLLLILSLVLIPAAQAQIPVDALDTLEVELWPDFDRSAVLVLLTGTLADDVPVPATVTLPLPDDATLNAVAYVNVESGQLENVDDADSSAPGLITFTTPAPTFRLEYYLPYALDGGRRDFTFDWTSDMAIDQVLTTVQQPAEASEFSLSPASDQPTTGRDGLLYHPLAARALPAGESYSVTASYNLDGDQLTADVLGAQQPPVEGPLPVIGDAAPDEASGLDWPIVAIVAGGLIIIAAVAWFLYTNNQTGRKRTPRPRPVRSSKKASTSSTGQVQFCHNCGQPVDAEDRFCRACGTAVKGR
ncbi:MAG: zinc ribbon domain-containing protein [Chloroflexota bacterium]|nr:MAG: zinc ribbon domain-containing protein [Chloroflexota bacterium]